MAELLVRDVPGEMIRRLEERAAAHGRSVEEEHRAILEQALGPASETAAAAARRFQEEDTAPRAQRDGWIPQPPQVRVRLC